MSKGISELTQINGVIRKVISEVGGERCKIGQEVKVVVCLIGVNEVGVISKVGIE